MKKIILVNPRSVGFSFDPLQPVGLPFSLVCLGTWLSRAGWKVELVDALTSDDYEERVLASLDEALYVGFSVMTAQASDALRLSRRIRQVAPQMPIVWGGIHVTFFPEQVLENDAIDFIVQGEGEEAATELADALAAAAAVPERLGTIGNLGWKESGAPRFNPLRRLLDMAVYPRIDYTLLGEMRPYLNKAELFQRSDKSNRQTFISIHSARGCPFDCTFCVNTMTKKMHAGLGVSYRCREISVIVDEVEFFYQNYGIRYFSIQDEDFFVKKQRVIGFMEELERRQLTIHWNANARLSYYNPRYINDEFMERLVKSGCFRLNAAVESGSTRMLKILRKEIDFRHVYECARMVRKFSLNSGFGFMIGLPGETKEDRYMTLAVAIRVARDISENGYFIGPQVYRPYPGTPLYAECVRLGFHAPEKLEDWEKVVESNVGFLEADTLPWLDAAALSDIIFIQRYFSLALTQKWSGFRFLPFYVWPLFFLLQADRALRQSLGWYSGFVIEKHLLNLAEGARRRLEKLFKTKIRRRNAFQARPSRVPSSDDPVH